MEREINQARRIVSGGKRIYKYQALLGVWRIAYVLLNILTISGFDWIQSFAASSLN